MAGEELRYLVIDVLNSVLLLMISVQNFKKSFVDMRLR